EGRSWAARLHPFGQIALARERTTLRHAVGGKPLSNSLTRRVQTIAIRRAVQMRTRSTGRYLLAWCVVAIAPAPAARAQPAGAPTIREDRIVAGSDKDFMEVRHLVLKGSNEAIGRTLGEIARERHHVSLLPGQDPLRTRAQRRYFEKNFPILFE